MAQLKKKKFSTKINKIIKRNGVKYVRRCAETVAEASLGFVGRCYWK